MKKIALLLIFLLLPKIALADDATQFEDGEAVSIKPGSAYVFMRMPVPKGASAFGIAFVRELSDAELRNAAQDLAKNKRYEDQESNVIYTNSRYTYTDEEGLRTFLFEVKPGTYVVAAETWGAGMMGTCMCMGTVSFEAKPGIVTDLGLILGTRDDKPTSIAELSPYVRGKDIDAPLAPFVLTVRPYSSAMSTPAEIVSLPRIAADFRAVEKFPNYFGGMVDRMAPVPGVLGYDRDGHVLDLKASTSPPPPAKAAN